MTQASVHLSLQLVCQTHAWQGSDVEADLAETCDGV